jgi:hypothetical protein
MTLEMLFASKCPLCADDILRKPLLIAAGHFTFKHRNFMPVGHTTLRIHCELKTIERHAGNPRLPDVNSSNIRHPFGPLSIIVTISLCWSAPW